MKKSEILFGNFATNSAFIRDMNFLADTPQDVLDFALDIFLKSKYRSYYHIYIKKFAKNIKLTTEDAHTFLHLLFYFGYVVVPKYEVPEIILALREIVSDKADNLNSFLTKLKDKKTQEIFEILDLVDDEIGDINPHYENVTFNLQNRIVLRENKIIKNLPIITLQFITSEEDGNNILELLEDDLDSLIEKLNDLKQKFSLLNRGD